MAKVYFRTFGCPTNFSESESMQELLKDADFKVAENPEDAFVIVLNICTVKGNTVSLREIKRMRESYPHKKIIVAGCITKDIIPEIRQISSEISLISTHNTHDIVSVVEETINDNPVDALAAPEAPEKKADLPKSPGKPIAIIPICSGCTGNCTYCSVRVVKGKLVSYPMEKIVEQCRKAVANGSKEIWITAQDTASYMLENNEKTKLPELIKSIAKIPGKFMVRVGMMNINNLLPAMDEMLEAMKSGKVFKFLHLPVQSGSDKILGKMKRKYSSAGFIEAVKKIRDSIPEITISTDIICGFPGENEAHFRESVNLVREISPDVLNVSRFRKRLGTAAAEMENQIPGDVAKERSKAITSAFEWEAYRKNRKWLGWEGEILIDEKGKEGTGTFVGRSPSYKPVIVEGKFRVGDFVKVKIDAYSKHDLRGRLA